MATVAAVLADVHAHGYGKTVTPASTGRSGPGGGAPVPGPVTRLRTWSRAGGFAAAVARVLRAALGPCRWEPWNAYGEHRTYPSPRAAHLVHATIRVRGRHWAVDPVRDLLVATGTGPGGTETPPVEAPVRIVLGLDPGRLPDGYGALAGALAWLECGHVAAALAEAAAGYGLVASWRLRRHGEGVVIRLDPGGGQGDPAAHPPASPAHHPPAGPAHPPRSSGLGPRGLAVDPRPVPGDALTAVAGATAVPPPGSPATAAPLRHRLAVRAVTGRPDGWYGVAGGTLRLHDAGAAMEALRPGVSDPRGVVGVAAMNAGWVMTAALGPAVRAGGAAAYHRTLLAAGATAQHVGTAAAGHGLFCRPMRAVHEAHLEAAAAAPATHDFVYLLLLGRCRVRDFAYDLTATERAE